MPGYIILSSLNKRFVPKLITIVSSYSFLPMVKSRKLDILFLFLLWVRIEKNYINTEESSFKKFAKIF